MKKTHCFFIFCGTKRSSATEARTKMSSFGDDEELAEELPPNQSLQRLGYLGHGSCHGRNPCLTCLIKKAKGEKNTVIFLIDLKFSLIFFYIYTVFMYTYIYIYLFMIYII